MKLFVGISQNLKHKTYTILTDHKFVAVMMNMYMYITW